MRVRDLMRTFPRHCSPSDSVPHVGRIMAEAGIGVLPVVDASLRVTGVITDRDVCCALSQQPAAGEALKTRDAASTPPWTCHAEDEIRTALAVMRAHSVRRLPVVGGDGHLEGMLSFDEIVLSAQMLVGDRLGGPLYAEVIETLRAILRPEHALAPVASPS